MGWASKIGTVIPLSKNGLEQVDDLAILRSISIETNHSAHVQPALCVKENTTDGSDTRKYKSTASLKNTLIDPTGGANLTKSSEGSSISGKNASLSASGAHLTSTVRTAPSRDADEETSSISSEGTSIPLKNASLLVIYFLFWFLFFIIIISGAHLTNTVRTATTRDADEETNSISSEGPSISLKNTSLFVINFLLGFLSILIRGGHLTNTVRTTPSRDADEEIVDRSIDSGRMVFLKDFESTGFVSNAKYAEIGYFLDEIGEKCARKHDLTIYVWTPVDTCLELIKLRKRQLEEIIGRKLRIDLHQRHKSGLTNDGTETIILDGEKSFSEIQVFAEELTRKNSKNLFKKPYSAIGLLEMLH